MTGAKFKRSADQPGYICPIRRICFRDPQFIHRDRVGGELHAANVTAITCIDAEVLSVRNITPVVVALVVALWSGLIARGSAEISTLRICRASSVARVDGTLMRFRRLPRGLTGRGTVTFRSELSTLAVRRAGRPARVFVSVPIRFEQTAPVKQTSDEEASNEQMLAV